MELVVIQINLRPKHHQHNLQPRFAKTQQLIVHKKAKPIILILIKISYPYIAFDT